MMASKSPRNGLQYKKDQASCIWGFINIFEFRIGRSTRKLLADGKQVGSSCSSTKLKMPNSNEKSFKVKIQGDDDDDDESEVATLDLKTSVKELMEEEMFGEESAKDQRNDGETEPEAFDSHKGRSHTKKKCKWTYKAYDRSRSMSLSDLDDVKNVGSDDLQIMMEELGQIHLNTNSFRKKDVHTDKTDRACPVLEEKLSAAIEMLVNQKSKNNREFEEDELMEALQILSSNKELCWKLIQDPNSRLVNHMESLEDRVEKGRKSNSKLKSNLVKKNVALETSNPKQGNFFRRRSKSHESYPLVEDERSHRPSSKIVILKPGPAGLQFPGSPINVSSSRFSFTEIKRRLKKAMGKERHGIAQEAIIHKKQSDIDKGMSGENIGWSSPNRDHFYTERFAKPSPSHFKRGDKKGKPKDGEEISSEQYIKLANADLDIPCELNCDNLLEKIVSSTKDEVAVTEILDTEEPAPTGYQKDGKVFDASCEPISFSITTKSGSSDVTEAFNTGASSQSSELAPECISDSYGAKEVIPMHSFDSGEVEYPQNEMVDRTEQPSPVSVLEPLFPENDINPATTMCQPVELETQPHKIRFEEPAETSLDQQPYTLAFLESEESAFEYVEAVLLGSGLNWDEFLSSWLSSDQILDQSLFDEVDLLSDWSCRKLLFDCTNEVLTEVCARYFGSSLVKHNIRGIPKGMDLIHEVWIGVEWHLLGTPLSHSLDQLVQKDMAKCTAWMDHKSDLENVGIRIEAAIFEELVEETVLCFANDISEGNLISLAESGIEISIN